MAVRFIKQAEEAENKVICQQCRDTIADLRADEMTPSPEECYKRGAIPVPNLGWFCSQPCAEDFEKQYDVRFARTASGKIDYYEGQID